MTVTHGYVRLFRVGGLCGDRFETAPSRQAARAELETPVHTKIIHSAFFKARFGHRTPTHLPEGQPDRPRFATMPPPSITGRTPLTPNPSTVAIDSLRRTFNPMSATNLFPDETPDTDRCNTTETAHFSDIDEDDPSPLDDELIPQIDHQIPTNSMEFHRESPDPSSPHDDDDKPPSTDNGIMVQTQTNNGAMVQPLTTATTTIGVITDNTDNNASIQTQTQHIIPTRTSGTLPEESTTTSLRRQSRNRSRPNATRPYSSRMAANNAAHSETSTPVLGDHMSDDDDDGP